MTELEVQGRLRMLAGEYVALVEAMQTGQYADDAEWRTLSSDRTLVHDELLRLIGMTRAEDMYAYCREMLARTTENARPWPFGAV